MSKLPFQLGIHPINWVGEDVKEHGDATTCAEILDDIQRLGLTGTEMGRKYPTDPAILREELSQRNIKLVSQWKSVLSPIRRIVSRSWTVIADMRNFCNPWAVR